MYEEKKDIFDIAMSIFLIAFAIMVLTVPFLAIKQQKIDYEIEKMKIEQGTYDRKEVKITNEGNEKPNKFNTFLGI